MSAKWLHSKGYKIGYIDKVVSFFVAISLGKGICFCKHYQKINSELFAGFLK